MNTHVSDLQAERFLIQLRQSFSIFIDEKQETKYQTPFFQLVLCHLYAGEAKSNGACYGKH